VDDKIEDEDEDEIKDEDDEDAITHEDEDGEACLLRSLLALAFASAW
jgi:hypothetical protein